MLYDVIERKTDIWGLKYEPSIEPAYSDDDDFIEEFFDTIHPSHHYSLLNQQILCEQLVNVKTILEIGVYRSENFRGITSPDPTSSDTIFQNKDFDCIYLGIDKHGKQYLDNEMKNIHTFSVNSLKRAAVRNHMQELGMEQIDLLVIDGWHSVTQVLNDWQYTEWLSQTGVVVFHDTNVHPGPIVVFDAVDETLFDKQKFGENKTDWGIAICKRI